MYGAHTHVTYRGRHGKSDLQEVRESTTQFSGEKHNPASENSKFKGPEAEEHQLCSRNKGRPWGRRESSIRCQLTLDIIAR